MRIMKNLVGMEQELMKKMFVVLVFCFISVGIISHAETANPVKRVLILHWQNAYAEVPQIMDQSIINTFESDTTLDIEYYTEYLDFSKFTTSEIQAATLKLLHMKYAKLNLDAVITTELADYHFVTEHRNDLFPDVPLIFSGLSESIDTSLGIPPNATGNFKVSEVDPTIEVIKKLQPDVENIVFVIGSGQIEASYYRLIKNSMIKYADDFNTSYTIDMTFEEINALLKQLPIQTAVVYTSVYMDSKGTNLNPGKVLDSLCLYSTAPIYVFSDAFIQKDVVGGHIISYEMTGKDLAERALAIFHGKKADEIPVTTLKSINTFNWSELQKWDIKEKTLPNDSVILGKQESVKNQVGIRIIYFISGGLFLLFIILIKQHLKL